MKVNEAIVKFLEEKGVDSAFAVTGSSAIWLFHALGKSQKIRTICTNHEQAAAMAADGWARVKGLPGVVFLTNGPGVTNALSGVAQAWTDSVPLFIISGEAKCHALKQERETTIRQYGTQSVRTGELVGQFVKFYHLLNAAGEIESVLQDAYRHAVSGRPGPVWISVPIDLQNAECPHQMQIHEPVQPMPQSCHNEAKKIKQALLQAKRPLILAGHGVRLAHAKELFQKFIETYNLPVVTSRMGNDIITTEHPLFVGRPGNWGSRPAHFAIQKADVLLVLGSRLSLNTTGHSPENFAPDADKYMVDIDCAEFQKPGIEWKETVRADLKEFLAEILSLEVPDVARKERISWCSLCQNWKSRYPVMQPEYRTAHPMSTYHFIERLSFYASPEDTVLSDTGSCCNIVSQVWNLKEGQRILLSGGLSCMGYWATAMGVARAFEGSNRRTLCVVGDGSFQMNLQELGTIVHYGLPIKLFVIHNNGYQIIRISQSAYTDHSYFAISPETGVGLADTERIAKAYNIPYRKVSVAGEVDKAIQWALNMEGAVILEAEVAEDQLMLPRLTSKVQADGTFKSAQFEDLAPFLSEEELRANLED